MDSRLTFADMVSAFSIDYECVFFVDMETNNYAMYAFRGNHQSIELTDSNDFWADTRVNLESLIWPDDRKAFAKIFNRASVIRGVEENGVFNLKYRLTVEGKPAWYQMKVGLVRAQKGEKKDYLFVGVNNINVQEREHLELEQKVSNGKTYGQILMALAERYDALYMVDLKTNHYVQYRSERVYNEVSIALEGEDFFNQLKMDALQVVYKEDVSKVTEALSREFLLKEMDDYGVYSLIYRLNHSNGPTYVRLVASYADNEKGYVVISVTNVDAQMRREEELKKKASKSEVYGQIVMALAERYDALYMVDLETDRYAQYKTERIFNELSIALEGEDFFNQLQKDAMQVVYKDDVPLVQAALARDILLKEIDENGVFSVTYRLNSPKGPLYVSLVAVYADKTHVVFSVTNVDAQVRREQKIKAEASLAFERARRDDLTGIKNKNAYGEFEQSLNEQIESDGVPEFAIAICDVNGLKTVNDTQGHKAGDDYIKSASKLVCETFKHSPVFRVGGDEFVAILRGSDFENRKELENKFHETVKKNADEDKVVVACGISVFDRAHDRNVAAVFERADALMYKNKMSLKGGRDEILNTIIRTIGARTTV